MGHKRLFYQVCISIICLSFSASVSVFAQNQHAAIETILSAVVGIEAKIPSSARTASTLGAERFGSGVVIDSHGLVVTIGYLILEANSVELKLADGRSVPATIVAYDYNTGFGLVRANQALDIKPLALGDSTALQTDAQVLVVARSDSEIIRPASVVDRREFAGYWEYLLDNAIFTSPPHPLFGGAALLGPKADLLGIGSLVVGDAGVGSSGEALAGNMFVPIAALEPILGDLLSQGRSMDTSHPWLGIFTEEMRGLLFITRLVEDGPAAQAGLALGDVIIGVAGKPIKSMADFYRQVWALGDVGVSVPLTILRRGELTDISVTSADRYDWLQLNPSF